MTLVVGEAYLCEEINNGIGCYLLQNTPTKCFVWAQKIIGPGEVMLVIEQVDNYFYVLSPEGFGWLDKTSYEAYFKCKQI